MSAKSDDTLMPSTEMRCFLYDQRITLALGCCLLQWFDHIGLITMNNCLDIRTRSRSSYRVLWPELRSQVVSNVIRFEHRKQYSTDIALWFSGIYLYLPVGPIPKSLDILES